MTRMPIRKQSARINQNNQCRTRVQKPMLSSRIDIGQEARIVIAAPLTILAAGMSCSEGTMPAAIRTTAPAVEGRMGNKCWGRQTVKGIVHVNRTTAKMMHEYERNSGQQTDDRRTECQQLNSPHASL
nr:hypothetical protein [Paenibacillus sp. R14(2021)]